MGFCSGTDIFDPVVEEILLTRALAEADQYRIIAALTRALYDADWDCESDSRFYKHPLVRQIFRDLAPDDEDYSDEEIAADWYSDAEDADANA